MTIEYAALVEKLKRLQEDLGDPRDVDTPRRREAYFSKQAHIARTISTLMSAADLDQPIAELAELEARRARLWQAQQEIERLIEAAEDWRTITDSRARDRAWGRQQDLLASRRAIVIGVEYLGGWPCLPQALKPLLGVTIEPDGRERPDWFGSLQEIEARLAEVTPSPSGDGGRDATLFAPQETQTTAFQFSVTEGWRGKIRDTLKRLDEEFAGQTKVLVYLSNRSIGAQADDLRKEFGAKGIYLDVRDRSWFLDRMNTSTARQAAAERLIDSIVTSFLANKEVIRGKAQALEGPFDAARC